MKPATLLERYLKERNRLLRTITKLLKSDPNVRAAWLFGSLGRGDEDALSDIDLWVVMNDDHTDNVITQPRQHTSQIDNPVLFLEAPQNAPEGGAYLMTCYDAPVAPHIVDWYWQPQSLAYIPGQVRLLFDRVGVIHKDQPIQFPIRPVSRELIDSPVHFISFFWMMLMITTKYAYRSPRAAELELLPLLIDPIVKAQQFLGQEDLLQLKNIPPHRSPDEKMQLFYQLAGMMSEMMAAISEQGGEVPALITPGAYRYLKLIDLIFEDRE